MNRIRYILWGAVLITVVIFGGHQLTHMFETKSESGPTFQPEFTLINHNGKPVTEKTFRGNWTLVFFGFTSCPDICPTTLAELANVMDGLGAEASKVTPLFITVDPDRDRFELMAEYVSAFHPSIIGLTGSGKQIAEATESFKAYFERVPQDSASGGYSMAHTSAVYLISPDGYFVRTYQFGTPLTEIVKDLKGRI